MAPRRVPHQFDGKPRGPAIRAPFLKRWIHLPADAIDTVVDLPPAVRETWSATAAKRTKATAIHPAAFNLVDLIRGSLSTTFYRGLFEPGSGYVGAARLVRNRPQQNGSNPHCVAPIDATPWTEGLVEIRLFELDLAPICVCSEPLWKSTP